MLETAARSPSFLESSLVFVVSLFLSIFADSQLKVIRELFAELAMRSRDGVLSDLGLFDLHLQFVFWAVLWSFFSLVWISTLSRSPILDAVVGLLGAAIGGVLGVWLASPAFF